MTGIELDEQDSLDLARSRTVEQEGLDVLDEPTTQQVWLAHPGSAASEQNDGSSPGKQGQAGRRPGTSRACGSLPLPPFVVSLCN